MSKKITLLFPGQGSQYVGMGSLLKNKPAFERLGQADASLGYSLSSLMLEGPIDQLSLTQNTQPAILTYSIALFDSILPVLEDLNIEVSQVLGHSVGEYAALVAAKSLDFEDAVKAVYHRGQFMQEAVAEGQGKMVAFLKIPLHEIERACEEVSTTNDPVMPANYNEPSQTVVSGTAKACDLLVDWVKENYKEPFRAVELNVSAPFHSSLMLPAAKKLNDYFEQVDFQSNQIDYIANIDAKKYDQGTQANTIKENLHEQVAGAVKWSQSIQSLSDETICLEVGPGKVLTGLVRKINRNIKVLPIDKEETLHDLGTSIKELFK